MNHRIWAIQYAGSPRVQWSRIKPTPTQLVVAGQLGVNISPDDTFAIVAANILEKVSGAIGCSPKDVSNDQHALATELGIDVADCESSWSAFVRIKNTIESLNIRAMEQMQLEPSDLVVDSEGMEHVVASVREDGEVFFKAGGRSPARHLSKK